MIRQLNVLFSGTVQGVGFRFTVNRIARHFVVTGFVRNLPNGKVSLLAEGDDTVLGDFLVAIQESEMGRFIQDAEIEWKEAEGEYSVFGIAT